MDQFLCERRCDPNATGTGVRLSCLAVNTDCGDVLSCLDNPTEDPNLCATVCTALDLCPGQIGPDGRYMDLEGCQTSCQIDALINTEADHPALAICLDESNCIDDEIDRCFNGGASAPTCDNAWTAYEECGNDDNFLWAFVSPPVTNRATYLAFCNGLISMEGAMAIEPRLECVINAAANGLCDDQIACSF